MRHMRTANHIFEPYRARDPCLSASDFTILQATGHPSDAEKERRMDTMSNLVKLFVGGMILLREESKLPCPIPVWFRWLRRTCRSNYHVAIDSEGCDHNPSRHLVEVQADRDHRVSLDEFQIGSHLR